MQRLPLKEVELSSPPKRLEFLLKRTVWKGELTSAWRNLDLSQVLKVNDTMVSQMADAYP